MFIDSPATLRRLGEVPDSDLGDIDAALGAARAALGSWQRLLPAERKEVLRRSAARVRAGVAELARLMSQEGGTPLCESHDCLEAVAALFEASVAPLPQEGPGVLAVLLPSHLPLLFLAAASAPALAAGHVVIVKAPVENPLACLQLATLLQDLPACVLTVLTGQSDAGLLLARHPGVERIDFTGSPQAGSLLVSAVPDKPVQMQVSRVDACIVSADVDLDLAVPGIAWARLCNAGQGGLTFTHLYVERGIAAEFVDRMHQFVGFLDVDDPLKAPTDLGPLISLQAAREVEDQVGQALREGARLILGGRRFRPSGLPGYFFQPTILTDVAAGTRATREGIRGPVITVTPVETLLSGLQLAQRSAPGCGVALYAGDAAQVSQEAASVPVSAVRINDPRLGALGPFSGLNHPGLLRALGGVAQWLPGTRSAYVATVLERKPWWFPYAGRRDRT